MNLRKKKNKTQESPENKTAIETECNKTKREGTHVEKNECEKEEENKTQESPENKTDIEKTECDEKEELEKSKKEKDNSTETEEYCRDNSTETEPYGVDSDDSNIIKNDNNGDSYADLNEKEKNLESLKTGFRESFW